MEKLKANCSVIYALRGTRDFCYTKFIPSYETDPEVLEKFQNHFSKSYAADVISYLLASNVKFDGPKYEQKKFEQFMFAQSIIDIFYYDAVCFEDDLFRALPRVKICGGHVCKGYELPVFFINIPSYALSIAFKSNFARWSYAISAKYSIKCEKEAVSSSSLDKDKEKIHVGMPVEMHFDFYNKDKNNKTFISWSDSDKEFYEFLLELKKKIKETQERLMIRR